MFTAEQYAGKIAGLLRKAEDPKIADAERELLVQKAQELMSTYSIEQAMVDNKRIGRVNVDEIVRVEIPFHSSYSRALFQVGAAVAYANDCKVLIRKGKDLMHTDLVIVGFERDVERVRLLTSSLQIQVMDRMDAWWKSDDRSMIRTQREKFKMRRQFVFGFAEGLEDKLFEARRSAIEARQTTEDIEQTGESVALVLRDKTERIEEWMTGNLQVRKGRSSKRFANGGGGSHSAGYSAGQSANTGGGGNVGSGQRSLAR